MMKPKYNRLGGACFSLVWETKQVHAREHHPSTPLGHAGYIIAGGGSAEGKL